MRVTALRSAAMVLAVAVSACHESTGLDTLAAHYELTSYAGDPLPHTWRVITATHLDGTTQNCKDEITGGSLLFDSDGVATELIERSLVCDGQADLHYFDSALGPYTVSGSNVDMTLEGSLADLPGTGPYAISAELAGRRLVFDQTVTQTPAGAVTDRTQKTFTSVN